MSSKYYDLKWHEFVFYATGYLGCAVALYAALCQLLECAFFSSLAIILVVDATVSTDCE